MDYYIYVQLPGKKRFLPMSGYGVAHNIINAEIFTGDLPQIKRQLEGLIRENPTMKFHARKMDRKSKIKT